MIGIGIGRDLRYALRGYRRSPGFAVVALLVLTLGIGATTTIFTLVDTIVLRPLPFESPDRLVALYMRSVDGQGFSGSVTPQDFLDWRAQQQVFDAVMAVSYGGGGQFITRSGGSPEELRVQLVTASFFGVLRSAPRLGRPFTEDHEVEGHHRVAVISNGLWHRRFGADPGVVGQTMRFDDGLWEIIGVMPPGFTYPATVPMDMWAPFVVPASQRERGDNRSSYLQVVGRLRDGITVAQAQAQMDRITTGLAMQFPRWFENRLVVVRPLHESFVGTNRTWMLMLLGGVVLVLLIACVNVANLQLVRSGTRRNEIAVRAALGASRGQLARGLLAESLLLSLIGTACALVLSWWGIEVLRTVLPAGLPRASTIALDLRVFVVAALVAVVTGALSGLLPAVQFSRSRPADALQARGRSDSATRGRQRSRSFLIVAQVALAVVLVTGAGLFVSSYARLVGVDLGIDVRNIMTVGVYPRIDFADPEIYRRAVDRAGVLVPEVVDRIQQLPGVEVASAIAGGLPLSGNRTRHSVRVPGRSDTFDGADAADIRRVTPDYARTVGQPLLRGRYLDESDHAGSEAVVVLNDVAAQRYFTGQEALGQMVELVRPRIVVGIVGSVRFGGPEIDVRPEAYVSVAQGDIFGADIVVRASQNREAVKLAVRSTVQATAPDLPVPPVRTLEDRLWNLTARHRFTMLLVVLFGVLALTIAAAGIYGVVAYSVVETRREIGVRLALGASPGDVLLMVLRRMSTVVAIGLLTGLSGAWVLSRTVETFLFNVQPHDPIVYGLTAALVAGIGFLAAFLPARRAARIDPLAALRMD